MAKIYYDSDAEIKVLNGKTIAIIGYGNQGRAQALNMKDSGVQKIIVGNRKDESWTKAAEDGFKVFSIKEASKAADILFMLIPDEAAPKIYNDDIKPNLKKGCVLNFSSGYNITFKQIVPPENADVIMVAPRMIGDGVRQSYLAGTGFPSFVAVEQNASGQAKETALAIAKAIGSTKKGCIETRFNDETYLDLIAEQATWPMILSILIEVYNFELGLGISEEAVLMELYLSKEPAVMMERMADEGLFKQLHLHSHTSQYGQLSRSKMVDKQFIRYFIEKRFKYIQSGEFANEWKAEQENGLVQFHKLLNEATDSPISQSEARLKQVLR